MTTAALVLPRVRGVSRSVRRTKRGHFPIENSLIWFLSFAFYLAAAVYVVFHLEYIMGDAYARVANGFYVLYSRNPHLAAIGLVWPPLPSFLDLPILAFKGVWPALANRAFAGSIESAAFAAGTVVLFNSGLKWAGVVRGMRWLLCAVWVINPMTLLYATQGMSESLFMFFGVATTLVFLRWCDTRRASLLPLMGVVAGLACLCRVEAMVLAFLVGVAVIIRSVRRGVSWRQIETDALLYALPAVFIAGLWLGTMTVIEHDPLFFIHSGYANGAQASLAGLQPRSWIDAFKYIGGQGVALAPAIIPLLAMVAAVLLVKRDRITGLLLLLLGTPVMAVDAYLVHKGQLFTGLRYHIYVIPFTFLLAVYVLRSLKGRRAVLSSLVALALVGVLGGSDALTAQSMGEPANAPYEAPVITAIATGRTVPQVNNSLSPVEGDVAVAQKIVRLDRDRGLILVDTSQGFSIVTTVPDPKLFVVSSDYDFEAAAAQPDVYHVEYFLVPTPNGFGALSRLNHLYPSLWATGGGFATLVSDLGGGGGWRLYKITGSTGLG